MRRPTGGGTIVEYLAIAAAILLGMVWLKSSMQTRTEDLMGTAIKTIPICDVNGVCVNP